MDSLSHSNARSAETSRHWQPEPADLTQVSLDDAGELQHWMDYFAASANRLHEAVSLMGSEVPRVRAYLWRFR